jgi:beta-glucosidase
MQIKGFKRIALKPGESKEVSFELMPEHLSMLNADMKRVVEPGEFKIMIGGSSRDLRLRGFMRVSES